ncbi:MAG: serine/threonine protein kinase, partial [Planctomycetota bacterium]
MSEVCKSLINDYITGSLKAADLEEGLASIFGAMPSSHVNAQSYLQILYESDKIDSNGFSEISQLISKVNIESTIRSSPDTDINSNANNSYFDDDKTLHLTDITDLTDLTDLTEDGSSDKTVIVRAEATSHQVTDISAARSIRDDTSIINTKVIEKPHKTNKYENLGPGVTLKERFVLLEKLGQGGMGIVFKAKDLLKVEAQDRDPYVAIKVLTDAFKKYSGSFIALQREASKAQRLAHPNVATVYDFDRDGNTVFMTMEFLEGKPLNQLIKEIIKKPLKMDQALYIIEELCSGLAYAHEKMLIHSDFKPGNCFLLNDGHVKLLDFGIARASTQTDEERENTMFDPAKLSAVTPAYATPEMFAGMNPDPRDDIYGL